MMRTAALAIGAFNGNLKRHINDGAAWRLEYGRVLNLSGEYFV
jgi:hypothetical protein